jgi:hypothetical protein
VVAAGVVAFDPVVDASGWASRAVRKRAPRVVAAAATATTATAPVRRRPRRFLAC